MGGGSSVQAWRSGAVFTVSSTRSVTALEGWITAAGDGYHPYCSQSVGGGFRFMLMERVAPGEPWTTIAWTAEHGELQCNTALLPNGRRFCCEPAVPSPISLPVETCAEMRPGRDYVFVYEAAVRPFDYWNMVPTTAANGGHPYHVITGGAGCGPPNCLPMASAAAATPGPGPTLPTPSASGGCISLFVDPNRDLQDLDAETAAYIPEGRLPIGPPVLINLVATMPASENFPAVDVTFSCVSSAWKGDAGNMSAYIDADFEITGPTVVPFAPLPGTDLVAAFTQVTVTDWAGEATFTAIPSRGGADHAVTLFVPVGAEADHLPDAWQAEHDDFVTASVSASGLSPCVDDDGQPVGTGVAGDGLAAWEEYRGFFVKGRHVRTDPAVKDLFVYMHQQGSAPPNSGATEPMPSGAFIMTLPTADHLVGDGDMVVAGRVVVNKNASIPPGSPCPTLNPQHGVRLRIDQAAPPAGELGKTKFLPSVTCDPTSPGGHDVISRALTPNVVNDCNVYVQSCRFVTPTTRDAVTDDGPDPQLLEYVAAHEVGHAVNITHYTPFPNLCPFWCPAPNDGGFPFPASDYFCVPAAVAPSNNSFVFPESLTQRRGTAGEGCAVALCTMLSERPECLGQVPTPLVWIETPSDTCGPSSVMSSVVTWWARPTCTPLSNPVPVAQQVSPWSDPCAMNAVYWTNLPSTYSVLDEIQVQVSQ